MKMNRIIAFILSVIFIFSVNVTAFAAEQETTPFEPALYGEIITFLSDVGLIDAQYYAIDTPDVVTRGQFAESAARIIGIAPLGSFVADFTDVPANHANASYIYAMKNAGYMSGVSADTFLPDAPVSLEQAVSVLVKLAGYNDVALATGGYPTGYMTIATRIGLFDNIDPVMGSNLTKGLLLELIQSIVRCDMLVPSSYGTSTSYTTHEGVNILSYYHNIYEGTGILSADAITTMSTERAIAGEVIINGERFIKANEEILLNSVGRKVNYFYKTQSGIKTIIHARVDDIKEISFVVDQNLGFSYTAGTYTYEAADKTLTYKIGHNYHAIYNMAELYPVVEEKMLPDSGTITLIDNDVDGTYEVVVIDEFINIIANKYSSAYDRVVDLIDPSRVIDFKKYETCMVIDPVGLEYNKVNIIENDIIEFYESLDGKTATAIVKRSGMSAVIDGIDENYIYAGSDKYLISADVRENVSSIMLGSKYNLYLNSKGELVYWTRSDDYEMGYIFDVKSATGGFDSSVSVKLYSTSGKVKTLSLADKVVNFTTSGTTISSSPVLKKDYTTIFPATNYRELIAYKSNSDGQISVVYHPMILTDLDTIKNPPPYPVYRLDYFNNDDTLTHDLRGNGFDLRILTKGNAPVLLVPPVASEVKDNAFRIFNTLKDPFYMTYEILPTATYTGDNKQLATYMVGSTYPFVSLFVYHYDIFSPNASISSDDFLITDIRHVYDKETMDTKVIVEGRYGKTLTSYELASADLLKRGNFVDVTYRGTEFAGLNSSKTEIEVGDYVEFVKDGNNVVQHIALLFDSKNKQALPEVGNRVGYVGEVTFARNNAIEFVDGAGKKYVVDLSAVSGLWMFEADKSKNRIATPEDFEVGDTIYLTRFSTTINTVTVYKD